MASAFSWEEYADVEITVAVRDGGGITISVANEHAVDSYNETFHNDISLPLEQARALRDWFLANVQ